MFKKKTKWGGGNDCFNEQITVHVHTVGIICDEGSIVIASIIVCKFYAVICGAG